MSEHIVHLMMESGKTSGFNGSEASNLMLCVAKSGIAPAVEFLLPMATSLEATDKYGNTPLSLACKGGHELTAKILISNAAKIEVQNEAGQTPLSLAASTANDSLIKLLLHAGAHVDSQDNKGRTPVSYAACSETSKSRFFPWEPRGNACLVTMLLEAGAHADMKDHERRTPLSYATSCNSVPLLRAFLDRDTDCNSQDMKGRSPISYAAQSGGTGAVSLLLRRGAKPDIKDIDGRTALSWVAGNGGYYSYSTSSGFKGWGYSIDHTGEVIKLLIGAGADPNSKDNEDQTPLLHACKKQGDGRSVTTLLGLGADPNSRSKNGRSALSCFLATCTSYYVYKNGPKKELVATQLQALTCLLDHDADMENRDELGQTALMIAASFGVKQGVSLLLERGADISARDNNGQTAALLATSNGHEEVAGLLLERDSFSLSRILRSMSWNVRYGWILLLVGAFAFLFMVP